MANVAAPLAARINQITLALAIPNAASIAGQNLYRKAEAITSMTAGPGVRPPIPNRATKASQTSKDTTKLHIYDLFTFYFHEKFPR